MHNITIYPNKSCCGRQAFMTMFQILLQKGWVEIMHLTMRQTTNFSFIVAIYFISYHLFVTLVRHAHKSSKSMLHINVHHVLF